MRHAPEIVEVDSAQLAEVMRRVEQALDEKDARLIRAVYARAWLGVAWRQK
jgi:hypothetical protein